MTTVWPLAVNQISSAICALAHRSFRGQRKQCRWEQLDASPDRPTLSIAI